MDVPLFYVMLRGPSPILNIQYVTKINLNLCTSCIFVHQYNLACIHNIYLTIELFSWFLSTEAWHSMLHTHYTRHDAD